MMTSRTSRHGLGVAAGALLLSTSAPWVRVADVPPTPAAWYRMLVGSVALFVLCRLTDRRIWRGPRYALRFLPVAACFALDLVLWHRCIHTVGPGLATMLANLQVFVMAGVGALVYGEALGLAFGVGLVSAFGGLWMLVGASTQPFDTTYLIGVVQGIGAAICYSCFLLGMRSAQQTEDRLSAPANLMWATGWCGLLLGGLIGLEGASPRVPNLESWGALLAYGLLCQVAAWMLITRYLPDVPASLAGLLLLLQPALAMIWDVFFFARPAQWSDALGGALVLVGLYLGSLEEPEEDLED